MMNHTHEISSVLTVSVKPDKLTIYEKWLTDVKAILEEQRGFVGIEVIRPSLSSNPEYLILIRFANKELLDLWRSSHQFAQIREESQEFVAKVERGEQQFGTEMFFSRPVSNIHYPKPTFWKQIIIGVLTVYPVILIANSLIRPAMSRFHPFISMFFMVCIVSPSMIFLMPRVSKLFRSWLYSSNE